MEARELDTPVITARRQVESAHRGAPLALPDTAAVFFMSGGMELVRESYSCRVLTERFPRFLQGGPVLQIEAGNRLCALHGGSGAPMAADTVEVLAASGVRRIVAIGMCGVFRRDVDVGDVLLPPFAWVEEGTSPHYDASRRAEPSERVTACLTAAFPEGKRLPVVSMDAVYRQTFRKEAAWRARGCVGVDMETSAVLTVARSLGLEAGAALIASDKHPESPEETPWAWKLTREARKPFIRRCVEAAMKLK